MRLTNFFALILISFFSIFTFAQKGGSSAKKFEVRVQYGMFLSTPSDFNSQIDTIAPNTPEIKSPLSASIDFTYVADTALLYGIRYEFFRDAKSANPGGTNFATAKVDSEVSGSRLNGLFGWRFLRISQGYLGLTSHFNLGVNKLNETISTKNGFGTITETTYTGKTAYGYGIALEGAYYAEGKFPTGLEIGYTSYSADSFEDSAGATVKDSSGKDLKMDLSGGYVRFYVGFMF
jgi:hypothetical protein